MIRYIKNYYFEIFLLIAMGVLIYGMTSGISLLGGILAWTRDFQLSNSNTGQVFATIFMSIFIEGLPFILLGVIVSSLIHVFVSEEMIYRVIPRNPILSIPTAVTLGLVLPICECGIVPITKRLMQKGMPPAVAFTFLLAAPVVNPITIFSTYVAFGNQWSIAFERVGLAAIVAVLVGYLFYLFFRHQALDEVLRAEKPSEEPSSSQVAHETAATKHHDHGCCHTETSTESCCQHHHHSSEVRIGEKVNHTLYHTIFEFFNTAKYFVLGALIAAFFQVFIGVSVLKEITGNEFVTILCVMLLAFLLSICSSADAFIASSLRTVLPNSSIFGFLVYGPMMDLKNFLMMVGNFRAKVVAFLFFVTTILTIVLMLWIY